MNFNPRNRTLMTCLSGSRAYGTFCANSDTDIRGVIIPPEEYWFGLENFEQYDVPGSDTTYHEFRKFLRLSANGNPGFLEMWWLPPALENNSRWWGIIKDQLWQYVLSLSLIKPHLGMARSHLKKIENQGSLFDKKDAYHVIRVLHQAEELLLRRQVTFPRPESDLLNGIRNGKVELSEILEMEQRLVKRVHVAAECSGLPQTSDYKTINDWLVRFVPNMLDDFSIGLDCGQRGE